MIALRLELRYDERAKERERGRFFCHFFFFFSLRKGMLLLFMMIIEQFYVQF